MNTYEAADYLIDEYKGLLETAVRTDMVEDWDRAEAKEYELEDMGLGSAVSVIKHGFVLGEGG